MGGRYIYNAAQFHEDHSPLFWDIAEASDLEVFLPGLLGPNIRS